VFVSSADSLDHEPRYLAPQKPTGIPSVEDLDGFAITIRIFLGLSGL
jgi:hypothetical protein